MSKNINSYLKGVTSGYAKTLLTMLIGLWMVPFTLQFLSRAEYGIFAIAADILIWLGLLQLGTGATLSSRAAQLMGRRDTEHLSELASTAFILQAFAALLTLFVGGVISLTVEHWFDTETPIAGLNMVVFILVLGASIGITAQVFNGLLVANKQIHVDNMLGILLFLIKIGLTVILLLMGYKLMALAWAALISTTIKSLISYARVKRYMPEINISVQLFKKEYVRDLLGNGIWFTVGGLAGILIVSLDKFMVGKFVSLEAVTSFIITGKLYIIAQMLHAQLFNVMRPYFGQLHGQAQTGRLAELYHAAFSASLFLSVLMASVIYLLNQWFIGWWVGHDFYLGNTVSFLFALNFVLQSSVLPNRVLLASTLFKMPQQNMSRVIEGLLNLALTIYLARNFGISGVLMGSIIATTIGSTLFMNLIARSYFQYDKSNGKSLLSYLSIASLVIVFFNQELGLLTYILGISIYLSLALLLLKGPSEKLISEIMRRRRKKPATGKKIGDIPD